VREEKLVFDDVDDKVDNVMSLSSSSDMSPKNSGVEDISET